MAASVACAIYFKLDNKNYSVLIDTVEDIEISLSSTITTHPVANGDLVADHMYKEPLSLSIRGSFGVNSGTMFSLFEGPQSLAQTQKLFERVKNEAVLCSILKLDQTIGPMFPSGRFLSRSNMVLSQITWTERVNSMGFSFTFTEVMITKFTTYDVNTDDRFLPSIELAEQRSFAETLLNWTQIDSLVHYIFKQFGFITEEFDQKVGEYMRKYAGTTVLATSATLAAGVVAFYLIAGEVGPVGWVVAGVATAVVGIVCIVNFFIDLFKEWSAEKKFKDKAFNVYKDEKKMEAEINRYIEFVGTIHLQILEFVNQISVWKFDFGENRNGSPKSIAVNVYNDYYIFEFNRINTIWYEEDVPQVAYREAAKMSGEMDFLQVYSGKVFRYFNGEPKLVCTINNTSRLPYSFDNCTSNLDLARTNGQYYMFLLQGVEWISVRNIPTVKGIVNGQYWLLATTIDPQTYWTKLAEVIKNAFLRNPS